MRTLAVLCMTVALAMAIPIQPSSSVQDTIVDLTPYFPSGLESGHGLLANLTLSVVNGEPNVNGQSFALGALVTMEVEALITDLSADGKTVAPANLILDAGAYMTTLDNVPQVHIQALIRGINRVSLGEVTTVVEAVIALDSNGVEMSRISNEMPVTESILGNLARGDDEPTTSDSFEIDVIVISNGIHISKDFDSDSASSSSSSDSSDSSSSSSSSSAAWDDKWEEYESSVGAKIHRAMHSACAWVHKQPVYVRAAIGLGMALVLFALFYGCLRCLAVKPASFTPAFASGKVYEYSEKNLVFPLEDMTYESKPLMSYTTIDEVERV